MPRGHEVLSCHHSYLDFISLESNDAEDAEYAGGADFSSGAADGGEEKESSPWC